MRDIERIPRIVELLRETWSKYPDLRLGQLICVVAGASTPFYIEDEETEERLKELVVHKTAAENISQSQSQSQSERSILFEETIRGMSPEIVQRVMKINSDTKTPI